MQERLENILLDVSKSPDIDGGQLDKATRTILSAAMEGLQITRVGVWLFGNNTTAMHSELIFDQHDSDTSQQLSISETDYSDYFAALRKERTIIANDAATHPATHELKIYMQQFGIFGMLDVPLRHKGEMIGVMCCESRKSERKWTEDEVAFAGILADIYGRAMSASERDQFEQMLLRQNEQLEAIVEQRTQSLREALDNFKQAQERLIETEKMAALGKLVAGVAHEVNTPLGISVTATTHCEHRLKKLKAAFEDGSISRKQLATFIDDTFDAYTLLSSNLERAATLIQNFKKTAVDQSSFELVNCPLADYLNALVISLKPMVKKKKVSIAIESEADIKVKTYQGALAQIITNLVSNCHDHAFTEPDDAHQILITIQPHEDGAVVRFKDNGKGMDNETRKSIFEPFYTTARDTGGSGLGLSIVYNLVTRKLKGQIDVQSTPGEGSEFILLIPNLS
ncbi:GAF sensor signal transduction histidine kinase [Idiomarina aquatica]|uniref:histidine kinase n=1 Tax=Idiomarina aquatica TaxID=1327752 RepID=A0A4R6PLM6_9GAMM|nr:GAF domain-containing sensor histidine kinase [Idiomarina aquatica]TDP39140.1 GAF sensor signal transduction histidine kinase [Idiomarina aquatica]